MDIFHEEKNYSQFLKRYEEFLSDYIDTYAYSLLPDHFHLLVHIKGKYDFKVRKDFPTMHDLETLNVAQIIDELFRRFFMSYSKAIDVKVKGKGSIFRKNLSATLVEEVQVKDMIYYIHNQPVHHSIEGTTIESFHGSSYRQLISDKNSKLKKNEVMNWFDNKNDFEQFHQNPHDLISIKDLIIEKAG